MSNVQYLSCAETAKLVRAALKESFPGVKFAVRSSVYSGGASINIRYTDGPTYEQVKAVAGMFEGAYFDGMTDYKGLNFGSLDGNEVRFGADFIFVNRDFSIGFMETNVKAACEYYGYVMPTITGGGVYGAYIADRLDYETNRRIMAKVSEISLVATQESATLARAGFLGDDGYGWNSTGRMAA
jgi:hypothetical protein